MPDSKLKMATLEEDGWALESGEVRNAAHPETFEIPSRVDRENVKPGQTVRLLFQIRIGNDDDLEDEISVERMWATVAERRGDFFVAVLDNHPASIAGGQRIDRGLEFVFKAEHVIDIADPPHDWLLETHGKRLKLGGAG